METMSALEPWDDTPLIEPMDDLYLASEARLLATLRAVAETVRTVLLIGHNPGMHELAVGAGRSASARPNSCCAASATDFRPARWPSSPSPVRGPGLAPAAGG